MATTSSFTALEAPGPPTAAGFRTSLVGALDGAAFAIPVSLGAATLVFANLGAGLLPAGLFALLLSLTLIHVAGAASQRPLLYGSRFFEATTLAAMMDHVATQLPGWGLPATSGVKLALLCTIGALAGLCVTALFLARADRLTRLIPTPVFAGFSNSIAIALLTSQGRALWDLLSGPSATAPVVSIALLVFALGIALRYLRPRWPGTTIALLAGLGAGLAWSRAGGATPMLGTFGWFTTLPLSLADFGALAGEHVRLGAVAAAVAVDGAILGAMIFINTTMAAEFMAQSDGKRSRRGIAALWPLAGMTVAGAMGSVPLSGSLNASAIAARNTALTPALMLSSAAIAALVYLSGIIGMIPLAAVCGSLLCEAWFMVDRPSARLLGDWARRRAMSTNEREDLALIAAVMAAAVLLNMVAAVLAGLLFGLVLFAARNARRPVRNVWTGQQLTSNCARSREDLRILAEHGTSIRIIELDGDLFFGAVDSLERTLEEQAQDISVTSLVLDWTRVRHIDTTVARAIAKFDRRARSRGVAPIHARAQRQDGELGMLLRLHVPLARFAKDLDRSLEQAENDVIRARGSGGPDPGTSVEAAALFLGLDAAERAELEAAMPHRQYAAGEVILQAGSPGDELMMVLYGSASVVIGSADGAEVRVAGVRRGATLGEIAFLDHARRSASVIADEATGVAVLDRAAFDRLSATHPRLVQSLLSNIALDLAARLRHSNRLFLSRQSGA